MYKAHTTRVVSLFPSGYELPVAGPPVVSACTNECGSATDGLAIGLSVYGFGHLFIIF